MSDVECRTCNGPCRVPDWARDGSWYANNPSKFAGAVARNHFWFDRARIIEVERVRAETRALAPASTFPCASCGKFAFTDAGVLCFWCRRSARAAVAA